MSTGEDFDLFAAGIRSDGSDLRISLEVLAGKLEDALPAQTRVQRSGGGLFGKGKHRVSEISVKLGDCRYELSVAPSGALEASRTREVGGIAIKHDSLPADGWVTSLTEALRERSRESSAARNALEELLR